MYMHKPRGLNPGEGYACSRTAVRRIFEGEEITVFWGNKRNFEFDTFMRRRPEIEGTVIASLSVNLRRPNRPLEGILNFYIITDPTYTDDQKNTFETVYLPRLKDWYCAFKQTQSISGCYEKLVIWDGDSFSGKEIRFT